MVRFKGRRKGLKKFEEFDKKLIKRMLKEGVEKEDVLEHEE